MGHRFIASCLLLLCSSLFSAAPILHLWTADRFCEISGITDADTVRGVIVGTEFPDIRYLTRAERDLTHPVIIDIAEVYHSKTPFEMGMKLHAWLDIVRENFIRKEVYDAIEPFAEGHPATLLKFIEDEMLADFYDGRPFSCCFDKLLPEELLFAGEEVVTKWHQTIQWTMSARPSWLLWAQSYRGPAFGLSAATLYNWSYLIPELKQQLIFKVHLYTLLDYIEKQIKNGALHEKMVVDRMFAGNDAGSR
jgi:hypothetical protein